MTAADGFRLVVTLDPGVAASNPAGGWRLRRELVLPFADAGPPDPALLDRASTRIGRALDGSGPVLVRCHEGMNRAALVCAWYLVDRGAPPVSAISAVRAARSLLGEPALYNESFVRMLLARG